MTVFDVSRVMNFLSLKCKEIINMIFEVLSGELLVQIKVLLLTFMH